MNKHYVISSISVLFAVAVQAQNISPAAPQPQLVDVIGAGIYDVQTFGSGGNRAYNKAGFKGAVWNAEIPNMSPHAIDYNFHDGSTWLPLFNFQDTIQWPEIDYAAGTEYIMGHNVNVDEVQLYKRSIPGPVSWNISVLPPDPAGHYCRFPRMRIGGANDSTIHVVTQSTLVQDGGTLFNGIDGALTYSRSLNGGQTWDIVHQLLPQMSATNYVSIPVQTYSIDVKGSTVAIVQNGPYNDWKLWKSTDNGNIWTTTVIKQFPIPAYDPGNNTTDIDSDGVADTVETSDGSNAILIDNNGMVHCWTGNVKIRQDTPGASPVYYLDYHGIDYWNESFGSSSPELLTTCIDLDGSGMVEFAPSFANYNNIGACSMPSAGIDQTSKIFLVYSAIVEHTSNGAVVDEQNYRNLYCMMSPDNGVTWTIPYNFTNTDFEEDVYPSITRDIDDKIHVLWQRDIEPGTSITDNDPMGSTDINFSSEDTTLFNGLPLFNLNFNSITGRIYYDLNQNGVFDVTENGLFNQPVVIMPGNVTVYTNSFGKYEYLTLPGTYTVTYAGTNFNVTSAITTHNVQLGLVPSGFNDFGIFPTIPTYSMVGDHFYIGYSCNDTIQGKIMYVNNGNILASGTIKYVKDPLITYINSSPPYSSISGDTIIWNFTNVLPGAGNLITGWMGTVGLQVGDSIHTSISINHMGPTYTHNVDKEITCSYDPNAKSVQPEGSGSQHNTNLSDTLIYSLYFQNTGTDTAYTVRIRDTLDLSLDISKFRVLGSSHSVHTTLKPDRSILFEFEGIMLPDSNVDILGSQGVVMYAAEPIASIVPGTVINNTAYIFFDFNPPIQTNTTFNTMVSPVGIAATDPIDFFIYPNPTNGDVVIRFENPGKENLMVAITDITGKHLLSGKKFKDSPATINLEQLVPGMYFIQIIRGDQVISTRKLVRSER